MTLLPALFLAAASLLPVDEAAYQKLLTANKGKVVVINFWATWCTPCREEMPALLSLSRKLAPSGIKLLLVSADEPEDEAKARQFLDSLRAPAPLYRKNAVDDEKFINAIDPKWSGALPATVIYDRAGKRVRTFIGEVEMTALESAIRGL